VSFAAKGMHPDQGVSREVQGDHFFDGDIRQHGSGMASGSEASSVAREPRSTLFSTC
jgi:hypothetical protein